MTIKTLGQKHDPHKDAKMVDLGGIDVMPLAHEVSDMMQGMGELRGAIAKRKQITEWMRELGGDHPYENKDVELWLNGLTEPHHPLPLLRRFLFHLADRIDAKDFGLREPPRAEGGDGMTRHPITPDNPLGIDGTERVVTQAEHNQHKAWMSRERHAIVGWLRRYGGDGHKIAKLIEDGQHWKS